MRSKCRKFLESEGLEQFAHFGLQRKVFYWYVGLLQAMPAMHTGQNVILSCLCQCALPAWPLLASTCVSLAWFRPIFCTFLDSKGAFFKESIWTPKFDVLSIRNNVSSTCTREHCLRNVSNMHMMDFKRTLFEKCLEHFAHLGLQRSIF